ncbi:mitochondrial carrier domain-containing protein [Kockiozyma suomiensis]|uniref:mitochondrial carrier domain-containing protein n=1 Tax=Kockiozyma suomiensis TaxID=1337062 RepID=UPI003343E0F8
MSVEEAPKKQLSSTGGFIAGALAACGAVTVTNPIEIVKTRMQLQGELASKGQAKKVYTGLFQALRVILKNEGVRGWQRGLGCAYVYQIGLNGCRLGFYEPIRQATAELFLGDAHNSTLAINVFSGATSGIMGAIAGSPFFLVKTRMQSYSPVFQVGTQTHYTSLLNGLSSIYKSEGFSGLYRGCGSAIMRTGAGSSVQLPIYNWCKHTLETYNLAQGTSQHLLSSAMSGLGVCVVMNPWDVIMTRMYNQRGNLYTGPFDCFIKTVKIEGPMALYKGFFAHLMRIGPHTIITLTLMESTRKLMMWVEGV